MKLKSLLAVSCTGLVAIGLTASADTLTLKSNSSTNKKETHNINVACKDANKPASAPYTPGMPIQPNANPPLAIPYTWIHGIFGSEQVTCKFTEATTGAPVGQATIGMKDDKTAKILSKSNDSHFTVTISPSTATTSYVANITVSVLKK